MNNKENYLEGFLIIDNDKNNNIIINNNIFNSESTTVESIYLPLSNQIKEIPYKEESKIFNNKKRSDSLNRISRSSIFFDKKKDEFFLYDGGVQKMDFEILENNKIEQIKPFKSKCILYDKKNNAFDCNLVIDKDYIFSFIFDKNKINKNKLYYNSDYYSFSLLYIKNLIPNTNLL